MGWGLVQLKQESWILSVFVAENGVLNNLLRSLTFMMVVPISLTLFGHSE